MNLILKTKMYLKVGDYYVKEINESLKLIWVIRSLETVLFAV